jgi:hypothetical protein
LGFAAELTPWFSSYRFVPKLDWSAGSILEYCAIARDVTGTQAFASAVV